MKCLRCDECLKVYKDPIISMVSKTGNNFDFCSYKCAAETLTRFVIKEERDEENRKEAEYLIEKYESIKTKR